MTIGSVGVIPFAHEVLEVASEMKCDGAIALSLFMSVLGCSACPCTVGPHAAPSSRTNEQSEVMVESRAIMAVHDADDGGNAAILRGMEILRDAGVDFAAPGGLGWSILVPVFMYERARLLLLQDAICRRFVGEPEADPSLRRAGEGAPR